MRVDLVWSRQLFLIVNNSETGMAKVCYETFYSSVAKRSFEFDTKCMGKKNKILNTGNVSRSSNIEIQTWIKLRDRVQRRIKAIFLWE